MQMSKEERRIQYAKLVGGSIGLILLTIIVIELWLMI